MPVKKKAAKDKAKAADTTRLCELLSRLPEDGFVSMVSASGLPREEARELCDAFRKLQE